MYAGYEAAKVEFEGREVTVDLVTAGGGLLGEWKARSKDDEDFIWNLIGFERCLSRAIDSDNGVGEYKGITVTAIRDKGEEEDDTTTHKIQLAFDAAGSEEETREYAQWLKSHGHDVAVGEYSSTYIDGECTSKCDEANRVANELWDGFCG